MVSQFSMVLTLAHNRYVSSWRARIAMIPVLIDSIDSRPSLLVARIHNHLYSSRPWFDPQTDVD